MLLWPLFNCFLYWCHFCIISPLWCAAVSAQSILHFHLLHYQKENDVLFVPVVMKILMFFITPTLWSISFPLSFLSAAFPSNDSETILQMPCTVRQLQALLLPKLLHVPHPSASFFRPVTLFFHLFLHFFWDVLCCVCCSFRLCLCARNFGRPANPLFSGDGAGNCFFKRSFENQQ